MPNITKSYSTLNMSSCNQNSRRVNKTKHPHFHQIHHNYGTTRPTSVRKIISLTENNKFISGPVNNTVCHIHRSSTTDNIICSQRLHLCSITHSASASDTSRRNGFGIRPSSSSRHNFLYCSNNQIFTLQQLVTSAVRIVFFHFESNQIVIVGFKSHQQ